MKIKVNISAVLATFIVLFCNAGMMGFIKGSLVVTLFAYAAVVLWLIFATKRDKKLVYRFINNCFPIIIFLVIIQILRFIVDSSLKVAINQTTENLLFLCVFIIMIMYYGHPQRLKAGKFILISWFVDTIISSFYTVYRLIENPMLSRYLASTGGRESLRNVSTAGVLGYNSIYGLVLIVIALVGLVKKMNLITKIGTIICTILFMYTIIQAQFFISILIGAIGIISCILSSDDRLTKRRLISAIPISICVGSIVYFGVVSWIPTIIQSGWLPHFISERLEWFYNGVSMNELITSDRGIVYSKTLASISDTHGLGLIFVDGLENGGHSELLDKIAIFGVALSIVLFYGFWKVKKYISSLIIEQYSRIYNIVWIMFICFSILNTSLWCPITMVLLLIIPMLIITFSKSSLIEKNK